MRKEIYLPLIAVALLLSLSTFCQRSPFVPELNDLQTENLKGAVQSIDVKTYLIEGKTEASFDVEQQRHTITFFNKKGNQTLVEFKGPDGTTNSKYERNFDEKGRYKGLTAYIKNEVSTKIVMLLNDKGNEIGGQVFEKTGEIRKRYVYKLDADGRQTEMREYDSKDSLISKSLNYYYKEDNVNSTKRYGKEGKFISWSRFAYNDKGLLLEEKSYEENGTPKAKISFTYDERGNLIEKVEAIQNATNTTRYVYTYDKYDNITSQKKYDKQEKLMEIKVYAYNYDAKGNWLEKLEYVDGVETNIVRRIVSYY